MYNSNHDKSIKQSTNFQLEDYHLGYKLEHTTEKLKSLFGTLALKNAKGDFFATSDLLKQTIALGCHHKHSDKAWHSYEVLYDLAGKTEGIYGHPVVLKFAG